MEKETQDFLVRFTSKIREHVLERANADPALDKLIQDAKEMGVFIVVETECCVRCFASNSFKIPNRVEELTEEALDKLFDDNDLKFLKG